MKKIMTALCLSAFALTGLVATPTTAQADPVGGLIIREDVVKAGYTQTWTFTLHGNETTRIRLSGDGDTCLELRVYDEFGNLVASDTLGFGDDRQVFVTPKWRGKFKMKITNIGSVANQYILVLD